MLLDEGPLGFEKLDGPGCVALLQRLHRPVAQDREELELEGQVIFGEVDSLPRPDGRFPAGVPPTLFGATGPVLGYSGADAVP